MGNVPPGVVQALSDVASNVLYPALATAMCKLVELFHRPPQQPAPLPRTPGKSQEQLRAEAQKELGIDTMAEINFAFVGDTGTGKSSLINAIRGIFNRNDPGAAPSGATETTQEIKRYRDPKFAHISFWDLPGSGTVRNPATSYWEDKKLYSFDHLLIIGAARFHEFDIDIAKLAVSRDVPVTFIRNKMDQDIENEINDQPDCCVEEIKFRLRSKIIDSMKADLKHKGIDNQNIYLINKRSFNSNDKMSAKYAMDEARLIERVLKIAKERRYW